MSAYTKCSWNVCKWVNGGRINLSAKKIEIPLETAIAMLRPDLEAAEFTLPQMKVVFWWVLCVTYPRVQTPGAVWGGRHCKNTVFAIKSWCVCPKFCLFWCLRQRKYLLTWCKISREWIFTSRRVKHMVEKQKKHEVLLSGTNPAPDSIIYLCYTSWQVLLFF